MEQQMTRSAEPEPVSRRMFVRNAGAVVGGVALCSGAAVGEPSDRIRDTDTIEISIVPTERAWRVLNDSDDGIQPLYDLSGTIEKLLSDVVETPVFVRIEHGGEPFDTYESAEDALVQWRKQGYDDRSSNNANLLIVSQDEHESWDYAGYANIAGPMGVCVALRMMDSWVGQALAMHEIGHMLGLEHHHGKVVTDGDEVYQTIMSPKKPNTPPLRLEFSSASTALLREVYDQ